MNENNVKTIKRNFICLVRNLIFEYRFNNIFKTVLMIITISFA